MPQYEIRYMRDDGKMSVSYRPDCLTPAEARWLAQFYMRPEFACVEIWKDFQRIETIARQRKRLH